MTLGELLDRVTAVAGLDGADALRVAQELLETGLDPIVDEDIVACAKDFGLEVKAPAPHEAPARAVAPELTMDPGEVLAEVFKTMPRVLTHSKPVIGKAPMESEFYRELARDELVSGLPDDTKLLIGSIDLVNRTITLTLYDEANDLDRTVGPIDLDRYATSEQLDRALRVLLSRLQARVLLADFN